MRDEEERSVKRELDAKARKLEKEKRDAEAAEKKAMLEADREKMLRRNQNRDAEDIINQVGVKAKPTKLPETDPPTPTLTPAQPTSIPAPTTNAAPAIPEVTAQPKKQVVVVNPAAPFIRKQSAPALLSTIEEAVVLQTYNAPGASTMSSQGEYIDRIRPTSANSLPSTSKRMSCRFLSRNV